MIYIVNLHILGKGIYTCWLASLVHRFEGPWAALDFWKWLYVAAPSIKICLFVLWGAGFLYTLHSCHLPGLWTFFYLFVNYIYYFLSLMKAPRLLLLILTTYKKEKGKEREKICTNFVSNSFFWTIFVQYFSLSSVCESCLSLLYFWRFLFFLFSFNYWPFFLIHQKSIASKFKCLLMPAVSVKFPQNRWLINLFFSIYLRQTSTH